VNTRVLPTVHYEVFLEGTPRRPQIALGRPAWDWVDAASVRRAFPTIVRQLLATILGPNTRLCHDCRFPYPVRRRRQHAAARSADALRQAGGRKSHRRIGLNKKPHSNAIVEAQRSMMTHPLAMLNVSRHVGTGPLRQREVDADRAQ
jgi:hypothetical protein